MEYNDKQISILKVAEQLFSEKGFEATSVREISKRAGINLAMISYYFGSKEKLMEALFVFRSSLFKMKVQNVLQDDSLDPLQTLMQLTEYYFDKVYSNYAFHKIMLKEINYLDSTVVFDHIQKMKNANFAMITEVIEQGISAGQFNPEITTDAVISLINGTVSNYALNEKYYRNRWQLDPEKSFEEQTGEKIKKQLYHSLKAILLYHE